MLRVDLAELLRKAGKHIVVDVNDMPVSDEDITYLAPAVGRVTITNGGSLVLVRGKVSVVVSLECGRCLTEVREPIVAEIEEQYSLTDVENPVFRDAQISIVADEENEVPAGLMEGTVMDLNVLIRQAALLAAPISPICKEDCLGFCQVCGKNRNDSRTGCACAQPVRNTPLAGLKQLFNAGADTTSGNANGATAG